MISKASMLSVLRVAVMTYLAWALLLYVFQRKLIFVGAGQAGDTSVASRVDGLEQLWLDHDEGRTEAWLVPARGASADHPAPAVIMAHGNAELIDTALWTAASWRARGYTVLMPEYRGYGRSEGTPSEATITADFVAFRDRLAARDDVDADRIVYFGRSLGGGVVSALARQRPPAALILLSTFTSLRPFARARLVPDVLVRDPFDSIDVVRDYEGPVLVIHGTHDSMIPHDHGVQLAEAAGVGRLISYPADHNDCPPDWDAMMEEITAFLDAAPPR